jgi:hypothetical protein
MIASPTRLSEAEETSASDIERQRVPRETIRAQTEGRSSGVVLTVESQIEEERSSEAVRSK